MFFQIPVTIPKNQINVIFSDYGQLWGLSCQPGWPESETVVLFVFVVKLQEFRRKYDNIFVFLVQLQEFGRKSKKILVFLRKLKIFTKNIGFP